MAGVSYEGQEVKVKEANWDFYRKRRQQTALLPDADGRGKDRRADGRGIYNGWFVFVE